VKYDIKYVDDLAEEKIEKFIDTLQDSTKAKICMDMSFYHNMAHGLEHHIQKVWVVVYMS